MKDTRHFKSKEFVCKCCGKELMSQQFVDRLELARILAGIPFKIVSGYRCLKRNRQIGSKDTSTHIRGLAADIAITSSGNRFRILNALMDAGFCRFGIHIDHIHVDNDDIKSQNVIWLY